MDIKQLRSFITISETKNITKAAALLNIVQPAVSRQIHLLEDELGVELFERGRHGMHLTNEGKILEVYARRVLKEIETAKIELTSSDGALKGTVNVGILASLSEALSVSLMRVIKEKYPFVNLKITVGYSGHLKEWLESGEIDVALIYGSVSSKFLDLQPLVREQLWLIGAFDSKLNELEEVELKQMSAFELILPYTPHRLRTLIEQGFHKAKYELKISAEVNDLNVQKQLVKEGFGFTILPLVSIKTELEQKTLQASIINHPDFMREIGLALPNTRHISKLVHTIANEIIVSSKKAVRSGTWLGCEWIGQE
ncbi:MULTISPECIES: LysR family transcriptional regulator [unclassified Acinetobacter]|uniref:LysR family transcriptional regulator n=1 Tax=unclassified Acinetobacter TaxID=196816 RepID=UPI0015D14F9F|nr:MULTISPECIES: LysR family transcriptional regulator [unclassified Acinetobacter]UUS64528.1 LysR family transcriptional regulator [Acinetobacter sp. YH12068_T]